MTESLQQPERREMDPLDPESPPPLDRFCDVVLDGGVINGVVYPGFLIELARKFRFRSIGGTSVGAIAAALAAACEYNRRYGSDNGFNEGLAKMPGALADWVDEPKQITRIRSLFQPDPAVQPIFNWFVELLGIRLQRANNAFAFAETGKGGIKEKAEEKTQASKQEYAPYESLQIPLNPVALVWNAWTQGLQQFGAGLRGLLWWALVALDFVLIIDPPSLLVKIVLLLFIFLTGTLFLHPLWIFAAQIRLLIRLPGSGACTGMRAENSIHQGLSEWLHEGVQKSANLPLHKPLTFGNLWAAPGGPAAAGGGREPRSIDLRMITTCLSHGRIYELPLAADDAVVMFKLSELKPYFPDTVIAHLRRVSKPLSTDTCTLLKRKINERKVVISQMTRNQQQFWDRLAVSESRIYDAFKKAEDSENGLTDPDIRELPTDELPIVVAARLSLSVPVLFQSIPLIGFNLDANVEDIELVRLWFSDGGIGSNFPIHLFDKPIPRWPTFGFKILDTPPRNASSGAPLKSNIPYAHKDGADDNLMYPRDKGAFTSINEKPNVESFLRVLFSIYTSAKDGHDQSFLRMPDVRNRVVCIYINNRAGNMLNLKIEPEKIISLALDYGARGGENAAMAYLAQVPNPKFANWVNSWQDHRWVRFNMLTHGLRGYLKGFTAAVNSAALPESIHSNTLIDQILQATQDPPLRSRFQPSDEIPLTQAQSDQLLEIVKAISKLEHQLQVMDLPQPYVPMPMPVLRFKPRY